MFSVRAEGRSYHFENRHVGRVKVVKRRTNEDKRRAVEMALKHANAERLSNRQIAGHVGVDEKTIRTARKEMEATAEIPQSETRTGRDGRTINVANIGKAPQRRPDASAVESRQRPTDGVAARWTHAYAAWREDGGVSASPSGTPRRWPRRWSSRAARRRP